jgi:hypothetical protein
VGLLIPLSFPFPEFTSRFDLSVISTPLRLSDVDISAAFWTSPSLQLSDIAITAASVHQHHISFQTFPTTAFRHRHHVSLETSTSLRLSDINLSNPFFPGHSFRISTRELWLTLE